MAAGNEPFRMGSHNLQAHTKTIRSNISEYLGPTQAKKLLGKVYVFLFPNPLVDI